MPILLAPEGTTSLTLGDTMYEVDTEDHTVDVDDPDHAATMISLMGCTTAPRRAPAAPAAPTQNKRK